MEEREEIRVHSGLHLLDTAARIVETLGGTVSNFPERWACLIHPPDGSFWELAWESDGEMCLTVPASHAERVFTELAASTAWFLVLNNRLHPAPPEPSRRMVIRDPHEKGAGRLDASTLQ